MTTDGSKDKSEKVFYVGATSLLEAAWRWEANMKRGTSFISSDEKEWVDEECAKINAENFASSPKVFRPLKTYKMTIEIEEM